MQVLPAASLWRCVDSATEQLMQDAGGKKKKVPLTFNGQNKLELCFVCHTRCPVQSEKLDKTETHAVTASN